jgi:hypothetical protein
MFVLIKTCHQRSLQNTGMSPEDNNLQKSESIDDCLAFFLEKKLICK